MADQPASFGESNYETFADLYTAVIPTKPHNAYLADPAILSLLPDMTGLRVLDAGCGPGIKASEMLDAGAASVTAIDVTPRFIALANERLTAYGDRATVRQHDLSQPLDFAPDGMFDLVYSNLVLHYIQDWRPLMREFYRVLAPGGWLIFSESDPVSDWDLVRYHERIEMLEAPNYFKTQAFGFKWVGFGETQPVIWSFRRSLEESLNPVMEAGFVLDRITEAKPNAKFHEVDPERAERYTAQPTFMVIRARKPL